MKRYFFIIGLVSVLLTSCSSDDEPMEYTGPWEIFYTEKYQGIHNESEDFVKWFNEYLPSFDDAYYYSKTWDASFYTSNETDIFGYDLYNQFYIGEIRWIETVSHATEDELQAKVDAFEAFSIPEVNYNRKFDKFTAYYQRKQ